MLPGGTPRLERPDPLTEPRGLQPAADALRQRTALLLGGGDGQMARQALGHRLASRAKL